MDYRDSHKAPKYGNNYDKAFEDYDYRIMVWEWEKNIISKIINIYFPKTPENYLDFACGTGRIISYLEDKVINPIGIDVSEEMLEICRKKVLKAKLLNVDITKSKFPYSIKFNLITAFRFFLNAQDDLRKEVVANLINYMDKDCIFIINVHLNKSSILATLHRMNHLINKNKSKVNMLGINDVTNLLVGHGLEIINTYHFGVFPIINEKKVVCKPFINRLENKLSKYDMFCPLSTNLIYVCRRR